MGGFCFENGHNRLNMKDAAVGRPDAVRITGYLEEEKLQDPGLRGKSLFCDLSGLWRYRAGDRSVLCRIEDGRPLVLAVQICHRRYIYK